MIYSNLKKISNIKISIVIPNYNYSKFITEALDSIFDQEKDSTIFENLEVIVIDDCSTDNSLEVINQYRNKNNIHNMLVIKNNYNHGPAYSRNQGVKHATGNYLIFLDADDTLTANSLITIYKFIQDNNFPTVIISDHVNFINENTKKNKLISNKKIFANSIIDNKKLLNAYLFSKKLSITAGSIIFHKDIFNNIQFCEQLKQNEDLPVFIYAIANYQCHYLNFATVSILKHQESLRNQAHNLNENDNAQYLTDIIFTDFNLKIFTPKERAILKNKYLSQRYLSLFRSFYLARQYPQAKLFYHKAIKYYFTNLLKLNYLLKYIKIYI